MQAPVMTPAPGARLLRFFGDTATFQLRTLEDAPPGTRAFLRANIGRAESLYRERIAAAEQQRPLSLAIWRNVPMRQTGPREWRVDLALCEVGYFRAKAYIEFSNGFQTWAEGPDAGISVHPNDYRAANTVYCAFTRMFGASRELAVTKNAELEKRLAKMDAEGYTVIPPSGTFRDLIRCLPHIFETLGCRTLHLLPVNPTPTTYAKFGRFGSPYACEDLTAVDPALVEFDKKTTGIDQFQELTREVRRRGGRVMLDIVINHTGWGSTLQERHPEWFVREPDGHFVSPGAWGTIWEDLVELKPWRIDLWMELADAFLTWCRRGVDGFRCDAGYKVPLPVWQYIVAKVRLEFPNALFLLEGLGGSWQATEDLLTDGGMQWAYSELFQNYSAMEVAGYLDYAIRQSSAVGTYIHYSETHDNDRLAKRGKKWSLLRNRLCALSSAHGAFGFTCGVEWLAAEKIEVHQSRGLAWGAPENIVSELARLNRLLSDHPCFFDGALLTRLSPRECPVFALHRQSADGRFDLLVLVNTDMERDERIGLDLATFEQLGSPSHDILGQKNLKIQKEEGLVGFIVPAAGAYCLEGTRRAPAGTGAAYRASRARACWAWEILSKVAAPEHIGGLDWKNLAREVEENPLEFLRRSVSRKNSAAAGSAYAPVIPWRTENLRQITVVPEGHWIYVEDGRAFVATFQYSNGKRVHMESTETGGFYVAAFAPIPVFGEATLVLEHLENAEKRMRATFYISEDHPKFPAKYSPKQAAEKMILLTNGRGGMARLGSDFGTVRSKYDCALGANLHADFPVDRHIFVKRLRIWAVADGFVGPLDSQSLESIEPGPPAVWRFKIALGENEFSISITADMIEGENTTIFRFESPRGDGLKLTARPDLEDRNFHCETQRNSGSEHHFQNHCRMLDRAAGFRFEPEAARKLKVYATTGTFHPQAEWAQGIPHPIEANRGQVGSGDAYSPGWFEIPLAPGKPVSLVLTAENHEPAEDRVAGMAEARASLIRNDAARWGLPDEDSFGRQLALACRAYVAKRGSGKTVIAGYPWFLDWGRDTLIVARGLLSAGFVEEVREILVTFGRFEQGGTLPNIIHGEHAGNRDTSDAPLWYGVVVEETLGRIGGPLYETVVDAKGATIRDIVKRIATGYIAGTANGIRVDGESGLVWSPSHFTWMDTNHPAGTPREGYPIEIQVLWIRLLRQLTRLFPGEPAWRERAERAAESFQKLYWMEDRGYYADHLIAPSGVGAAAAIRDITLRSNFLFAIALGLVEGERARRSVLAAREILVVPGGLRTLAPREAFPPLPISASDGRLLNDPRFPYWGRYEGDEDTRRKPAYHNGTAWTWIFPTFCEALALAWDRDAGAVRAARSYLGSMAPLLSGGCLGHLPEILDGDAPHQFRGCDAQAWGVSEALRVWKWLQTPRADSEG
jgi:starch synthase (maltosyl-transferring)